MIASGKESSTTTKCPTYSHSRLSMLAAQPLHIGDLEQLIVSNDAIKRLLVACVLGSIVGIEREWKAQSAGVRTNLLISLGCAFFTLMSPILATDNGSNKGQVAANIVQGNRLPWRTASSSTTNPASAD